MPRQEQDAGFIEGNTRAGFYPSHLPTVYCLLPDSLQTAYCQLPTAYCLLPTESVSFREHLDPYQPYLLLLKLTGQLPDGFLKGTALSLLHEK